MNRQTLLLIAFGAMVVLQLWLPAQTAMEYENTLSKGNAFRFQTVLVDPNDPFRGKYILLDFPRFTADIKDAVQQAYLRQLENGQKVYCLIGVDERGFAQINDLRLGPPVGDTPYFSAKVNNIYYQKEEIESIDLSYSFDRFYMEESKAPAAERHYNEAIRDREQEAYALVKIRKGIVVLEDVVVNGVSITEVRSEW